MFMFCHIDMVDENKIGICLFHNLITISCSKNGILNIHVCLEIFDLEDQFRYFWKAKACSYLTG